MSPQTSALAALIRVEGPWLAFLSEGRQWFDFREGRDLVVVQRAKVRALT